MSIIRVCLCPCGRLGIQEVEAAPCCHACGTDDVDWLNVDSGDLGGDLEHAQSTLPGLCSGKEEKPEEKSEEKPSGE